MPKIENSEISESFLLLQTFNLRFKSNKNELRQKLKGSLHCKAIYPLMFNVLTYLFERKMFHSHGI